MANGNKRYNIWSLELLRRPRKAISGEQQRLAARQFLNFIGFGAYEPACREEECRMLVCLSQLAAHRAIKEVSGRSVQCPISKQKRRKLSRSLLYPDNLTQQGVFNHRGISHSAAVMDRVRESSFQDAHGIRGLQANQRLHHLLTMLAGRLQSPNPHPENPAQEILQLELP
jgi:hypothetical protein